MRVREELRFSKPQRVKTQKGSALMESALVFTTFMVITFGIMDWGRMMLANNFVSYSAREGARYAIVHGSASPHPAEASDVTTVVKNQAIALDPSKITVTTTWSPNNSAGSSVTVKVAYSFTSLAPYMPATINLASTSTMIISQ